MTDLTNEEENIRWRTKWLQQINLDQVTFNLRLDMHEQISDEEYKRVSELLDKSEKLKERIQRTLLADQLFKVLLVQ